MNKNFQILLVIPRYRYTTEPDYIYPFPIGLAYILAVLKKEGYNVDCLNLNHYRGSIEELMEQNLRKKQYDFVCTGSNALGYSIVKIIINSTREYSKARFILGGPIITTEPEFIYQDLKPDFGVLGEGEETIKEKFEES